MTDKQEITGLRLVAQHIRDVQTYMSQYIYNLSMRSTEHDKSKYSEKEKPLLINKEALNELEYMSHEYMDKLLEVDEALQHHYAWNSHHPNRLLNGFSDMSLLDLIEMLADWQAASSDKGDIFESLKINKERFNMSDELYQILVNTIEEII